MREDCVLLPTTSDRIAMIPIFLETLAKYEPERHLHIHLQDNLGVRDRLVDLIPDGIEYTLQVSPELLSAYGARVSALQWMAAEGLEFKRFLNVDDDLELTPDTHWQELLEKTDEAGCGFVMGRWVRHESMYEPGDITPGVFRKQIMIYNGGGMAFSEEVASLVRALKVEPSQFEDLWPLTAYVNGYQNYVGAGSLAIHRTGSAGGRQGYVKKEPRPPLCAKYVVYRQLDGQWIGNNYSIPMDSDVRERTKKKHREARAEKGWA